MNKLNLVFLLCGCLACFFTNCGDATTPQEPKVEQPPMPKSTASEMTSFLLSIPGSYGWASEADENSYDFLENGNLFIQGSDGEATMWEGKWSLAGDDLTMLCDDISLNKTLKIKKEGEDLVIGDKTYHRYTPEE